MFCIGWEIEYFSASILNVQAGRAEGCDIIATNLIYQDVS